MQMIKAAVRPREDVDETAELARSAVNEAVRRGVPPDPQAFALFFAYVQGRPDLTEAVDAEGDGALSLDAVERLHDVHLRGPEMSTQILDLGAQMERELTALTDSMSRRSESDGDFIGTLAKARDGMSLLSRPSSVRKVLRELIETSEVYAEQTELFAAELDVARAQIEDLTNELKTVRESALLDHLTGLGNRRRFDMAMDAFVEGRRDASSDAPEPGQPGGVFSLMIADLDRFKRINDTYGHDVGDSVIRQFAQTVRLTVKGRDVACRFGGEEFAVLLPDTGLLGARHVAERIRQTFAAQSFVIADTRERLGSLSASFGVAEHKPEEPGSALIRRADAALYRAKSNGRNRVSTAD
ncbi:MAG: diguanylate cyclase [Pseudomonadota bacterium]